MEPAGDYKMSYEGAPEDDDSDEDYMDPPMSEDESAQPDSMFENMHDGYPEGFGDI